MSEFNKKWLVLPVVAAVAAGGYGVFAYTSNTNKDTQTQQDIVVTESEAAADEIQAVQDWAESGVNAEPASGTVIEGATSTPQNAPTDAPAAVAENNVDVIVTAVAPTDRRVIGSADAPVTILDFSSLTCPHCATAHGTILPRLIEDYVKTGKVRIVFNDFPLNQQALDASKVSRCVDNGQYLGFMSMLFGSIQTWAFGTNHADALVNNAGLTGLSPDRARECLNDTTLEAAILEDMRAGGAKHGVTSTPTFVVNDTEVIRGVQNYAVFQRAIETELAKKQTAE